MGKPTGFLEYKRKENAHRAPLARIADWDELFLPLDAADRMQQGARCMNCGVPFCQAGIEWERQAFGCPLHNLIPEWNDMIMEGNMGHALSRLLKTNNFPEFTGRVCPAPCEHACICKSAAGSAVTIRENELSVIENAFASGALRKRLPPRCSGKKVAVVGSGPAGLAVADQLNHRGHSITVIEKELQPGGLLMYGIPGMKLPKGVVKRRIELMADEGVTFVAGINAAQPKIAKRLLQEYDAVVLCCGAQKPRALGFRLQECPEAVFATDYLRDAIRATCLGEADPSLSAEGRQVVIIGTGDSAGDCMATALRQGCQSVLQLIRRPKEDYRLADGRLPLDYAQEEAVAAFGKDPRRFGIQVKRLITDASGHLTGLVTSAEETLACDLLIAATGFEGCEDAVCKAFGVKKDDRQRVSTPAHSFRTNLGHVFAAGDMRRGQSLVVWAIAEGRAAAAEVDAFLMGYTNLR